ncbi:MAG: metallophosphoesterase [Clostridia bacterium]|nr:metallophosphoesterase [Clostridia bacterium]
MIRVLLISDTHGSLERFHRIKDRLGKIDTVFHAGDLGTDAGDIGLALNAPVYAVRGNCDDPFNASDMPFERVVPLGGLRFYLTHGHRTGSEYALFLKAKEAHCAAAIFGHTHRQFLGAYEDVLLVNPGSLTYPRDGNAGWAILEIENGDINVHHYSI